MEMKLNDNKVIVRDSGEVEAARKSNNEIMVEAFTVTIRRFFH